MRTTKDRQDCQDSRTRYVQWRYVIGTDPTRVERELRSPSARPAGGNVLAAVLCTALGLLAAGGIGVIVAWIGG